MTATDSSDDFPAPPRDVVDSEGRTVTCRRLDSIEPLVEMYVAFDTADRAQGIPPTEEPAIREWLDTVTDDESLHVVAWDDGRAIGHAMLVDGGDAGHELAIFVTQAYQGAGVGTELLETTLGAAQQAGLDHIWLSVERWNRPAIALYRKVGFEHTDSPSFEMKMDLSLS
jgi:ribosomal protein S18 acetylase RimI-like enzyme